MENPFRKLMNDNNNMHYIPLFVLRDCFDVNIWHRIPPHNIRFTHLGKWIRISILNSQHSICKYVFKSIQFLQHAYVMFALLKSKYAYLQQSNRFVITNDFLSIQKK